MREELKGFSKATDSEFIEVFKEFTLNYQNYFPLNYNIDIVSKYKVIEEHRLYQSHNQLVFEFLVEKNFLDDLNNNGVSSGILMILVDCMTSAAIIKNDPKLRNHVSVNLTISNLGMGKIKEGDKLIFVCEKLREEGDLVLASATIYDEECSRPLAVALHTKFFFSHKHLNWNEPKPKL